MKPFLREPENRLIISLGILSSAIIAFQLSLMQLLSVVQWHHFAYMIISVAMLGFGASGTLLAIWGEHLLKRAAWLVPLLMSLSGISMMLAFPLIRLEYFSFDAYLLFTDPAQFPILAANYLIFFIPFLLSALSIGILFIRHSAGMGKWYFSNLLGSGLGGILALLLFWQLLPQKVPPLTGLLALAAGAYCLPANYRRLQLPVIVAGTGIAVYLIIFPGMIPVSQYKSLARTLTLPDAAIVYRQPGLHGLLEVVESPFLRYAPAVSLAYTGELPVKKFIFVNAESAGVISTHYPRQEPHILHHTTQQLPYQLGKPDSVLVLNAGSGVMVAHALKNQSLLVDAVIENPQMVRLMRHWGAAASNDLFYQPEVRIFNEESRHFLASAIGASSYNLINLPLMDAFGGTSGLQALRENYDLTLAAFDLAWKRLSPQGLIAVSSWMDYPPRTTLKILATLAATARMQGITNPRDHILAVRSWGTITFVLKKSPVSQEDSEKVLQWCNGMFFDPVLLPKIDDFDRKAYNQLEDEAFFSYMDRILENDKDFFRNYTFSVIPATDNKPYFSQFLRISRFNHLAGIFGQENVPLLELGYLLLVVTLVQSTFFAIILIILPLFRLRASALKKSGSLLYFAALGMGYMFAEIILIQRFILYFGQAVFAIPAVITTMLISSGAGSLYSGRLQPEPAGISRIALLVAGLLLVFLFLLTPLMKATMAFQVPARIIFSLIIIGTPAFFMGMLFPLGIRYLTHYDKLQIPWAWGINGCLSVVSTSVATLLAVEAGFRIVILLTGFCYGLAGFIFLYHHFFFRKKTT